MACIESDVGAEAIILRTDYLGLPSVKKVRPVKKYRHPDLDASLRTHRTKHEVRMIREARRTGVRTPVIYDADLAEGSITMEYIPGKKVRDLIEEEPERIPEVCGMIGTCLAKMHSGKISHGDLTTSNMIMTDSGELCIIDFSLGSLKAGLEEMGVDLHLLERAFTSAHSEHPEAFPMVVEAYRENMRDAASVLKRVEDIKKRARYT